MGKTTAVAQISEIPVLTTEAPITETATHIDRTTDVPDKTTTTVALDFGCITIDDDMSCISSERQVRTGSALCDAISPKAPSARW